MKKAKIVLGLVLYIGGIILTGLATNGWVALGLLLTMNGYTALMDSK